MRKIRAAITDGPRDAMLAFGSQGQSRGCGSFDVEAGG